MSAPRVPTVDDNAANDATDSSELSVLRARVAEIEQVQQAGGLVDLLRHREPQLRRIVEGMSEGLMVFDGDGNVALQNRVSLRIHGFGDHERGEIDRAALPVMWDGWDAAGARLEIGDWPASRVLRSAPVHIKGGGAM